MIPVNVITSVTSMPPQSLVSTCGSPSTPPTSDERHQRKQAKECDGVPYLVRYARNEQWNEQNDAERIGQVDPPLLGFRVEAIHELPELGRNERPAGANRAAQRFRQAVGAAGAGPDRIDDEETYERRQDNDHEQEAQQRQDDVEDTAEQPPPQEAKHSTRCQRRR
jgi:hypothetical protein